MQVALPAHMCLCTLVNGQVGIRKTPPVQLQVMTTTNVGYVFAFVSKQGQVLIRVSALMQAAIGCCILLLLVPKMVLTLGNLSSLCFSSHQVGEVGEWESFLWWTYLVFSSALQRTISSILCHLFIDWVWHLHSFARRCVQVARNKNEQHSFWVTAVHR